MEDRTKLVWLLEDKDLPFPPFEVYPCEQRNYDPMECPALELGPEEYANYTVHEVTKPCTVSLNARSADGAEFAVYSNGGWATASCGLTDFPVPQHLPWSLRKWPGYVFK